MGFFDRPLFDFNGDGKASAFEKFMGMQMIMESQKEVTNYNGGDTYYAGDESFDDEDDWDDEDDLDDELELAGLDRYELAEMDEEERREALEDAGLDPDDYEDEF